ncbi:hypothetical protein NEHOM01_0363 [Nematocida homosporus]|uniref:uncharacterized protein n=1 Tax=Nematocida homosporus TaxID=1912981 RepID=UPI00221E413E|nr:uncharacterized protein NEHOM01_0363 [Nematocida homosporus]KAI5184761.1 hypothetical protein NEHOM01_0363 [Nematocida homosporus]
MDSYTQSLLKTTHTFMRNERSLLSLAKKSSGTLAKEYQKELTRYIKDLSYLERKFSKRGNRLNNSAIHIASLTSSSDPKALQDLISHKVADLLQRKISLIKEIIECKNNLKQHSKVINAYISMLDDSPTNNSGLFFPSSSDFHSFSIENLTEEQREMNHKILEHYRQYNKLLAEIEDIAQSTNVSKQDRKTIFSILFPTSSHDSFPYLSKSLRSLFGSRIASFDGFIKEVYHKSASKEIYLTANPDGLDVLICFVHFCRKHLICASGFLLGSISTCVLVNWRLFDLFASYKTSRLTLFSYSFLSLSVLFFWVSVGVVSFFSSWVFGYSLPPSSTTTTSNTASPTSSSSSAHKLYLLFALNLGVTISSSVLAASLVYFLSISITISHHISIFQFASLALAKFALYFYIIGFLFMLKKSRTISPKPSGTILLAIFSILLTTALSGYISYLSLYGLYQLIH